MRTFNIHNQTPLKTMQKATHTAGFFVEKNDPRLCMRGTENLFSVCKKYQKNGDFVTEIIAENIEEPEAHLFSAAPELLLALEQSVARVELANAEGNPILSGWLLEAKQAIAKAKGDAWAPSIPSF